jgi:predicted enzyme related to lactoylglutathione lyase
LGGQFLARIRTKDLMDIKAEKRIHELGGITVVSKTDLGKHSCYMKMNDPEGNQFGIYSGITE